MCAPRRFVHRARQEHVDGQLLSVHVLDVGRSDGGRLLDLEVVSLVPYVRCHLQRVQDVQQIEVARRVSFRERLVGDSHFPLRKTIRPGAKRPTQAARKL